MTEYAVLRMGDPQLHRVAEPVTRFDDPALPALIEQMFAIMRVERGVGLAAPQIGVSLRVVVFAYASRADFPDCETLPPTVLINPLVEAVGEEYQEAWEGCLSVPDMRGLVPRLRRIRYQARDAAGTPFERNAHGFHARVVQHECDHLDGILYPQRIRDLRTFGFLEELAGSGRLTHGALPCEDRY